jgi:exodeoxyribonuclease III
VKLVTWNVNSLTVRIPRVLEMLQKHEPDVVCLQETKCEADAFPKLELTQAGYGAVHHSAGRWAGVAILARQGLVFDDVRRGLQGEPSPEEARWIEATVGGLRIASVYVINGRAIDSPFFADKLLFLDAMKARASELAEERHRTVIAGDFNIAPRDSDVYDPEAFATSTHVTEDERGRLRELLSHGYVDAHEAANGEGEVAFTWWDYRQGHFHRKMGLRIDLAVVSAGIRVRSCGIDRDLRKGQKPSDHAPLLVELDV